MSPKQPEPVLGAIDAAGTIWQHGAFHRDVWTNASAGDAIDEAPTIVSKTRWLAERGNLRARNTPLGLQLEPGEGLEDVTDDIARFSLIALNFPKYSDGRAFSTATLLREKCGYRGELRAVGNVLNDQIPLMLRVGFDSLEVTHEPTRRALESRQLAEVKLYYQPSVRAEPPAGTRPWLRRAQG